MTRDLFNKGSETQKILWTGGWDSTFQLLQLLLLHKLPVTPFYLIDEDRKSSWNEIQAMTCIKKLVFNKYPETKKLLYPIQYYGVTDIKPDQEIDSANQKILERRHLGAQFQWFARFCKQHSINEMQLCIEKGTNTHSIIGKFVEQTSLESVKAFRISPKFHQSSEYTIFQYFIFPLLDFSKQDIVIFAQKNEWQDILSLTWFCHSPTKKAKPCGKCSPCLLTIREGLAWRLPLIYRLVSFGYRIFQKLLDKLKVKSFINMLYAKVRKQWQDNFITALLF